MDRAPFHTATMAAVPLPADPAEVPDWVHLVPVAQGAVETVDRRGPFLVDDAAAIVAASLAEGEELQIDENHAEDLASPQGAASPARGWIDRLEVRSDGIWGHVKWTAAGRALVADRAYRAMSPVILHDKAKRIVRILRASLVNRPNFRGLAALNSERESSSMESIAKKLGLAEDATEDQILDAIDKMKDRPAAAMNAAELAELGTALGVEGGDAKAVLAAAKLARAGTGAAGELQTQLNTVKAELDELKAAGRKAASEAFVDQALREGRAGVNQGNRDELVALHMEAPAAVEKLIGAAPRLVAAGGITRVAPPAPKDGEVALNAEQLAVVAMLGQSPEAYAKTLAAERKEEAR